MPAAGGPAIITRRGEPSDFLTGAEAVAAGAAEATTSEGRHCRRVDVDDVDVVVANIEKERAEARPLLDARIVAARGALVRDRTHGRAVFRK